MIGSTLIVGIQRHIVSQLTEQTAPTMHNFQEKWKIDLAPGKHVHLIIRMTEGATAAHTTGRRSGTIADLILDKTDPIQGGMTGTHNKNSRKQHRAAMRHRLKDLE